MAVIRQADIDLVFTVLDRVGISREAVVIPLGKKDPGSVRILPDQRVEIVVPEAPPVAEWLPELESRLQQLMAPGGES